MEESIESGTLDIVAILLLGVLLFIMAMYLTKFAGVRAPRIITTLMDMLIRR